MAFNAWKLKFQTGLVGRRMRGRLFIPGMTSGQFDTNTEQIGSSSIVTFETLVGELTARWLGGSPTSGLNLCIAHKDGGTPTPVTTITYDRFMTTMRTRKFGVGT
jgi:hypothetical protein